MHRLLPAMPATCSGVSPEDDGMSMSRTGIPFRASTIDDLRGRST